MIDANVLFEVHLLKDDGCFSIEEMMEQNGKFMQFCGAVLLFWCVCPHGLVRGERTGPVGNA